MKRPILTDPRVKHGTMSAYNAGCRCDDCRAANTAKSQRRRERRRAEGVIPDEVHGTATGYAEWHCRCDDCTAAHREARNYKRYYWTNPERHRIRTALYRMEHAEAKKPDA